MSKAPILLLLSVALCALGCSGKKRDFADGVVLPSEPGGGARAVDAAAPPPAPPAPPGSLTPAALGAPCASGAECISGTCINGACGELTRGNSGALSGAGDGLAECGDACSGQCEPGAARCASITERSECGTDALWGAPTPCPFACVEGACAGECAPGTNECLSSTRYRSCSDQGAWSEPADCASACVDNACAGECVPGRTQCASTTTVQTCSDVGTWGAATACQNACVGEACTGECAPGATRCATETSLQTCNEQGQFLAGVACPFACVGTACGGECVPASTRCDPASGVPQVCSSAGAWQSQAPCTFVCTGSGSCTGECAPGSRRCNPATGIPQLCSATGVFENQAACAFLCADGGCAGECAPGSRRCDPASGVPQICSNAATWQSQAACARGCQDGACIPQIGPGAACASGRDCTTGFCVDGVCCESDCSGVCAQCEAGTGVCTTPATDPDCDPVICTSNECRISSGDITTNLCRARGQCKDQGDCNFANPARGTPCDAANSDLRFCDGAGNCVDPTVACAGVSGLAVDADNVCCDARSGEAPAFDVAETFGPREACDVRQFSIAGGTPIECDADEDCRTGTVCCITGASSASAVSCRAPTQCNVDMPFVNFFEVCGSPSGFRDDCPADRVCSTGMPGVMALGWASCAAVQ